MSALRTHRQYTVAVVCAIDFEMGAFRYMLDLEHAPLPQDPEDDNSYVLGELGGHNIVLTVLPGTQGKAAAQKVSSDLSRTFPAIRWRLSVGVGGGVVGGDDATRAQRDMRLGDVVVAWPKDQHCGVVQYDLGRAKEDGYQLKGFLAPSSARLRATIGTMKSTLGLKKTVQRHVDAMIEGLPEDEPEAKAVYRRPNDSTDRLFPDGVFQASHICSTPLNGQAIERPPRTPAGALKIHYGLIASGDSLVGGSAHRDDIVKRLSNEGQVLCFETEAAGLATETGYTVIRGISHYVDSYENSEWQGYAAATAAAYAKQLLLTVVPAVIVQQADAYSAPSRGLDARRGQERLIEPRKAAGWDVHQVQGREIQNSKGRPLAMGNIIFN